MARKSYQELEKIKRRYKTSTLWSWSKYNKYNTSTYEFYLKYIARIKEDRNTSIYSFLGGTSHTILERLYEKIIKYEDMIAEFEDEWFKLKSSKLRFDRSNKDNNQTISDKYEYCMRHFFENYIPIDKKVDIERFVIIKIQDYIFQGYIDCVHKEGDAFIITDFKTSSIYKGKDIFNERNQLLLYAEALYQLGVPLENIKIRWDFLKYVSVEQPQANGNVKVRNIARNEIGECLLANARMWMKKEKFYTEEQIEIYLEKLIDTNDIKCLPESIKSKYTFYNCYVYVDFTKEDIDNLKNDIVETIIEINKKESEYNKTKDDKVWWEEVNDENSYYFANLCGYSAKLHKPYGEYLDNLKKKKETEDAEGEEDLSWLEGL